VKKIKQLRVVTPQGEAGDLHKQARFVFNYTATERAAEIALTMPLRAESHASGGLAPIFAMNRPEGDLLGSRAGKT
jgi:serine/threonine-protein kinase HipA